MYTRYVIITAVVIAMAISASVAFAGPLANAQEFQQKAVDQASQQGDDGMSGGSGSGLITMEGEPSSPASPSQSSLTDLPSSDD